MRQLGHPLYLVLLVLVLLKRVRLLQKGGGTVRVGAAKGSISWFVRERARREQRIRSVQRKRESGIIIAPANQREAIISGARR